MVDEFRVGVITATHGLKGEVKVFPTTDVPKRFEELDCVLLRKKDMSLLLHIVSVRFFKQYVIIKFKEWDSIEIAEKYKQYELYIPRDKAIPLDEDEYYIADLLGSDIILDTGEKLGILKDIITTGANDVYEVVKEDGKTVLIPSIKECIQKIDLESGRITVHMLDGLE